MAVLGANPTILDIQKTLDPDGSPARIIRILNQTNRMLDDMVWVKCNSLNHHQTTIDTSLPEVFFRQYNEGTPSSEGSEAQFLEKTALMEVWGVCDKELADSAPNPAAFRFNRATKKREAMNQRFTRTVIYGSAANDKEIVGLTTRYSSTAAANGEQIILGTGVGSTNLSVWLICWGEDMIHMIYPENRPAGIQFKDYGDQPVQTGGSFDVGSGQMPAYRDHTSWRFGLATPDWRYAVRGCNIDSVLLGGGSQDDLFRIMREMVTRLPDDYSRGRCAFYGNRTFLAHLENQAFTHVQDGGGLTWETVDGKRIRHFRGFPIKQCDALLNNEAAVA